MRSCGILLAICFVEGAILGSSVFAHEAMPPAPNPANRLAYLDTSDPFYVGAGFPKLTTPQWIGEPGVEAVVILSVDDLREPERYEQFLRPILNRLRAIDGRAAVSIMCLETAITNAQLQTWLAEGVALEVHTLTHRHPLLSGGDFAAGARDFHGSVDLLHKIPGNRPVAGRLPYCDSMNVASPRFFAEIFNRTSAGGHFLAIDSSVGLRLTSQDPELPREMAVDGDGRERFGKYLPATTNATTRVSMERFATTVADYPYPYVIGGRCWEFPITLPSDWQAHNLHGSANAVTLADWQTALDAAVVKQGVMTLCFHPHGWIRADQIVGLIDRAVQQHGPKVKFLTFREALDRINRNLLAGQPLRAPDGGDNGVRLLDLDNDGHLDVVIGNPELRRTRRWNPTTRAWEQTGFPLETAGAQFGILRSDGRATLIARTTVEGGGGFHFDGSAWQPAPELRNGLTLEGDPVLTRLGGRDGGVRLRDFNRDGRCELVVANAAQSAIFDWSEEEQRWKKLDYALPAGAVLVNADGHDAGTRFVDLNLDGYDDVYCSTPDFYLLRLFVSEAVPHLGWKIGWNDEIVSGSRTAGAGNGRAADALPLIIRGGAHPNNGAWFHWGHLVVQNEETDGQPGQVEWHAFDTLLRADQPPPKSPAETLATIRVHPGFTVDLVAQEPLTMDPVAFDWGPDGKLWIAEMGDYPLGMDGQGKPGGVIRFLQDTNHDGVYDTSTVFLDGVNFPNGVMPWRQGVLVSAAPEIFYAEDTDGDGRADVRRPLFVGFTEGNQQHRVNGFEYGLDNWIHAANGDSGGEVLSVLTGKRANIRGRDVRFRPDDGAFQTTAGQTQYGRHRDDWGNWFGNNNINWLWHYYLPEHYLVRNPHLAVRNMKHLLAQYPDAARLYPTSPFLQRPNWPDDVNLVTAASAAIPYRDELFGPEFATSVLICDPVYQVIHREVLEPAGVTFTSHRAASEPDIEFFTSSDNWCRPVFTRVGPDGALYVADMYRFVIEHPEWIPERMQRRLDLRAGDQLGRIYRVYPAGATLRPPPRLDRFNTRELVAALNHPNGWQRDTAQRLLIERADPAAVPPLRLLAVGASQPQGRLHALCTLEGLRAISPDVLARAFRDPHPAVRWHAVRLAESLLTASQPGAPAATPADWRARLLELVGDPELRVRYQLAFTLGEWADPAAGRALAELALRDFEDSAMQSAIMSSAVLHVGAMIETVFAQATAAPPVAVLEQLFGLAAALRDGPALSVALERLIAGRSEGFADWQFAAAGSLLDALDRQKSTLKKFHSEAGAELRAGLAKLALLFADARRLADASAIAPAGLPELLGATRVLGRGLDEQGEDLDRLALLLQPTVAPEVQQAALTALGRMGEGRVSQLLLANWRSYGPALRSRVLDVLFSRQDWLQALLAAVEQEEVAPAQVDPAHQQTLLAHAQPGIRDRAVRLFGASTSDRQHLVQTYLRVAELTGNLAKGGELFQMNCATCHQVHGQGTSIGADLGTVADRPLEYLLEAILHPNKAVEARYISYTVVTKSENEFSGIITAETPNSITLRNAAGEQTFLRTDIAELTSSSLSLMPEGFEAGLQPQDMADLLGYIKSRAPGQR